MNVLVTGFGPFQKHKVNPSWEAVKKLPNTITIESNTLQDTNHNTNHTLTHTLTKEYFPVEYTHVQEYFKDIHHDLYIHVGVGLPDCIKIETVGNNTGYTKCDIKGLLPPQNCCIINGPFQLKTCIPFAELQDYMIKKGYRVEISKDAGRYLCEFTLYTSLHYSGSRSVFIHVPPVGHPYTQQELDQILLDLVTELIRLMSIR